MALINLNQVAWQEKYTKIPYFSSNKWWFNDLTPDLWLTLSPVSIRLLV